MAEIFHSSGLFLTTNFCKKFKFLRVTEGSVRVPFFPFDTNFSKLEEVFKSYKRAKDKNENMEKALDIHFVVFNGKKGWRERKRKKNNF